MGCGCNKPKKTDTQNELMNENIEIIDEIKNDENKLKSVIKFQRFFRKKLSKEKISQIKQTMSNNNSLNNTQNIKESKVKLSESF